MEKTGQTFEMNVESFTLQSIFAMELHRFQDKIAEIVNCAIKELAIEKVLPRDAVVKCAECCGVCFLQFWDTVGWVSGGACGLYKDRATYPYGSSFRMDGGRFC